MVKWLLIFDNAEKWSILDPYWPDKGRGSVIVTSHGRNLLPQLDPSMIDPSINIQHLELESLPVEDGERLLKYHAGCASDDPLIVQKAAQDLSTRLDGLLALKQIGSYIKNCKMSIPKFCEKRPKESDLYTVYLDNDQVIDYEHNLASVWTVDSLYEDSSSSQQAFRLLCVLALLDPERIQETLFEQEQHLGQDMDLPLSGSELDHVCKPLINTSLVERTTEEDFRIHPVMLLNLDESICKTIESSKTQMENQLRIYRGCIGVAHVVRNKHDYFHYAERELKEERTLSEDSKTTPTRLATACVHMGIAYNFHSLYKDARKILKRSLSIRKSIPGVKREALFSPLYQLAHAYIGLRKLEKAADALKEAIADRINLPKAQDSVRSVCTWAKNWTAANAARTGILYYTLGDVRMLQGNDIEAYSLYTQAHAQIERITGQANPGTLHSKYKMAIYLVKIQSHRTASTRRQYLDEILYHYRLVGYLRPYTCRTALLYANSLRTDNLDATKMLAEAVSIFNEFAAPERRTAELLTEEDANSLISFDYL
ncbi:hypothetical protein N0V90_011132 [Kalmusia sp. IMI 367209]|nr:hypothetical protein N0V90_011132 [Kalmusia sp. IMI 367209]